MHLSPEPITQLSDSRPLPQLKEIIKYNLIMCFVGVHYLLAIPTEQLVLHKLWLSYSYVVLQLLPSLKASNAKLVDVVAIA